MLRSVANTAASRGTSVNGSQLEMATRPPGTRTRRISRKAPPRSGKNIRPNIENAASNDAAASGSAWPSATAALTFSTPSSVTRSRSLAIICAEMSIAVTCAASRAARRVSVPGPQATSRMPPGRAAPARSNASRAYRSKCGVISRAYAAATRSHGSGVASGLGPPVIPAASHGATRTPIALAPRLERFEQLDEVSFRPFKEIVDIWHGADATAASPKQPAPSVDSVPVT